MVNLPELKFNLPEWREGHFNKIRRAEQKLAGLAKSAGINSDGFKTACDQMVHAVCIDGITRPTAIIKAPLDVRAFAYLLANDHEFASRIKVTSVLLAHLKSVRSPMSRLALTQFIRAYFVHFDLLADDNALKYWSVFLRGEIEHYVQSKGSNQLSVYAENAQLVFSIYGPSRIVRQAHEERVDFDLVLRRFGLTGFADARYIQLCRYQYYLGTLKELPVGADHDILAELTKPAVANSPYTANKQLGHEVLEILIDRSTGNDISQSWQSVILSIAGDPRVPKSSPLYQQWWSLLGEARIQKVRSWLSRFDLKLFLQILEQSARDEGNEAMQRMFASRKVFMEGLLNEGLVADSRLFLNKNAVEYLKRSFNKKELPDFARVSGTQTSMIHLNLMHKVQMLEGSHSFSLKLMDKTPAASRWTNRDHNDFKDDELRSQTKWKFLREFGQMDGYVELKHDVHLNWQHNAVEYLRSKNIEVDIGALIPPDMRRLYKSKFGTS